MRFIEFSDGAVVLAPRRGSSHKDMVWMSGRTRNDVVSAGFLPARYACEEAWAPYGSSVGLNIAVTNPELSIPQELYVGKHRYGLLYASRAEMLEGLDDVQPAHWGMTAESVWGDVLPVYAPLHPNHLLRADDCIKD